MMYDVDIMGYIRIYRIPPTSHDDKDPVLSAVGGCKTFPYFLL